jgi:hypothetical protein
LIIKTTKGSKMVNVDTIKLEQPFTTLKSGVTGIVKEIVQNPSGSVRVRLDIKGKERWTTVKPMFKIDTVKL